MTEPTPIERDAFVWMQGRMIELLLRHDVARFVKTFQTHTADQVRDDRMLPYRDIAVLFYLCDELFESILPRIKRRLSFAAPREILTEDLPPRGRIDWARTATANLRDRPTEVPLEVQTRQRRRHFATPENLLTVATILEYQTLTQHLLDGETARKGAGSITHPLNELFELCTRELAFLQFASLVRAAEEIVDGYAATTLDGLEAAVEEKLLPGHNSAYNDLLAWRHSFKQLQLLDRTQMQDVLPMLGVNPKDDDYLYQTWLFYEFGEMLQRHDALKVWDTKEQWLSFVWGIGVEQRTYTLQHDRAVKGKTPWVNAPGIRPDFYIAREDRQEIRDNDGTVIWREPGYVLDAKYYRPKDDNPKAPSEPIKRMIADLQLMGERHGALLFAFHGDTPGDNGAGSVWHTTLALEPRRAQFVQPDVRVELWRTQPSIADDQHELHDRLRTILDHVHVQVKPIEIRCHGVFLDTLSANAQGALSSTRGLVDRQGEPWPSALDDVVICPKPHIAPWRIDLVSVVRDCCQNGTLCHIMRQPNAVKPRRLAALEEITDAIKQTEEIGDDEIVIQAATQQVLTITRRYAQLLQPNITDYKLWIRDKLEIDDLFDTTPLLTESLRETLALARFLWEQIEHIKASNFAGPALLFTGVLEEITRVTFYKYGPELCDANGKPLMKTLGSLGNSKGYGGTNWVMLEQSIVQGGYWLEQVTEQQELTLSKWIDIIKSISYIRNDAAHKANVSRKAFQTLTNYYFGSSLTGIGVLNGLLLAWKEPT